MSKEKIKAQTLVVFGTLQSVSKKIIGTLQSASKTTIGTLHSGSKTIIGTLRSVFKYILSKERVRAWKLFIFGILEYIFLPVLCGFLTAGILTLGVLEKLGLDRFGFANFPTIQMQGIKTSTYTGLMLIAGLGAVLGFILLKVLRYVTKLKRFNLIDPSESVDAMPIPSLASFVKSVLRVAGIPLNLILLTVVTLELAKLGILPEVTVDTEYETFDVTLLSVIIIAAIGCLLMLVFDMLLTTILRKARVKEIEVKELR